MIRDRFPLCLVILFTTFGRAPAEAPTPLYVTERMIDRCPTPHLPASARPPAPGAANPPAPPSPPIADTSAWDASCTRYLTPRQRHRAGLATTFGAAPPSAPPVASTDPTTPTDAPSARQTSPTDPAGLATTLGPAPPALAAARNSTRAGTPAARPPAPPVDSARTEALRLGASETVARILAEELAQLPATHVFAKDPIRCVRLVYRESTFNPRARGPQVGRDPENRAMGLFQFMPGTARRADYDLSLLRGDSEESIRYQVRCGLDWAGRGDSPWVSRQWQGDCGPTEGE